MLDLFFYEKGRLETITNIRTQLKSSYSQTLSSFQSRKYYQIKITIIHRRFGNLFLWKGNCLYAIKIFRHTSRAVKFCSRRSATPWIQLILSNYSYSIRKLFLTMRKLWCYQSQWWKILAFCWVFFIISIEYKKILLFFFFLQPWNYCSQVLSSTSSLS